MEGMDVLAERKESFCLFEKGVVVLLTEGLSEGKEAPRSVGQL